jgi:hypothetical protein
VPRAKPTATAGRRAACAPASRHTAAAAGLLLAGAVLTACSTGSETSFSLFVDPGKYQYNSCAQIATETKTWLRREQELKSLMDKADQSTGGAAVGFIAYKAEYVAASEELELLRSTARSKKCEQDEAWRSNAVIR